MEKPNQHIQTLGRCWKGFEWSNPGTDFVEGLVFLSFWKAKVRPFFWKSTMVASTKRTHESTSDISCCLFLRSKTETKQWRFYALSVCGCVSEASARDLGEFEQDPMILWNFFQVHTCQDIEHQLFVMNHLRSGCNCSGKILLEDHVFFSKCFLQSLHARLSSFPTNYPRSSSSGSLMVEQNGRLGSTVAGILAIFWSIPQMLWNHFFNLLYIFLPFVIICYVVVSSIFIFTPTYWADDPIWWADVSNGVVQPPTSLWFGRSAMILDFIHGKSGDKVLAENEDKAPSILRELAAALAQLHQALCLELKHEQHEHMETLDIVGLGHWVVEFYFCK